VEPGVGEIVRAVGSVVGDKDLKGSVGLVALTKVGATELGGNTVVVADCLMVCAVCAPESAVVDVGAEGLAKVYVEGWTWLTVGGVDDTSTGEELGVGAGVFEVDVEVVDVTTGGAFWEVTLGAGDSAFEIEATADATSVSAVLTAADASASTVVMSFEISDVRALKRLPPV
jgi:hypothetical protein